MGVTTDISVGLRVAAMCALDSKSIAETLADLQDLGEDNAKALTYYEGMPTYCVANSTLYRWKEVSILGTGALSANYIYPPNTIVDGKDYSGKPFNFIPENSSGLGASSDLFYLEPSVNIEILNNPSTIDQAFHFGMVDIGSGLENVGLIKTDFVAQSNYDPKAADAVGDEIKLYSITEDIYLGHFVITAQIWNGYHVLQVIETGNWEVEGEYATQKIVVNLLKISDYTLSLQGNVIRIIKGTEIKGTADLTALLNGNMGATIVSGLLDAGTGIVTFTMSDASTFDVDFSALLTAEDYLEKEQLLAVKGRDIHENLFVAKAAHEFVDGGFSSADINTNWNTLNFGGFPYPSNIDFVVCRYDSNLYLLVRRTNNGFNLFGNTNSVLSMSFFTRQGSTRSAKKLAYIRVLCKPVEIPAINDDWQAFPIWNKILSQAPWATSSGYFDELPLVHGEQSANAWGMVSIVYEHKSHLNKSITLPYQLTNDDFGRVLHITNTGALTIGPLMNGFECGIIRKSATAADVTIGSTGGATLSRAATKNLVLANQYDTAYVMANSFEVLTSPQATNFIIFGDLEDS